MRLLALTPLLLLASALADNDSWSWGKQRSEPGDQLTSAPSASGSTSVTVIEDILESGRAGKSLEGFGQIYEDPDVQQAITAGNETQARHYIKERLCGLGLMACELDAEGKYLAPQDLIYAQPVHIKPVGRPIPAVPVGGASVGGYGPPRPVPLPPRPGYGPPPPPLRPYLKKPIYEPEEKPVVVVGGTGGGVQTHVHHHYHHGDKVGLTGVIDTTLDTAPYGSYGTPSISGPPPPGPLYGNSISPTGAGGLYPSGSSYGKPDFYKKQLNLKGSYSSGNGLTGSSSSYSPPSSFNPSSSYNPSQTFNTASSLYSSGSSNYNPGSSNFNSGSSNFNSGSSNYPGSSNYNPGNSYVASTNNYNRYPNYESPRVDSDCFCVPFDQCLPHEIARKEDGYFIDPRTNGGSTIEALGPNDVVITDGNGTMTVVTKPKREDTESKKETEEKKEEEKKEEKKERRRREASDDAVAEATETEERKHKPRKFGLGGGGGGDDDSDSDGSGLKLRPTFGVSFGLPSGGGGGYPINPYGPNPAINPYYGSVGGNGLDLGLVSVNPLLSVQVTKDEYGEKVVKPLVNLHVTPNHGLIHKVGHIIHKFKEPHYGGYPGGYPPYLHQHHHQHYHSPPPPPIYHHKPSYYPYKPSYGPPPRPYYEPYAPSFNSFRTDNGPFGYDNDYKASSSYDPSYVESDFKPSLHGPSHYDNSYAPSYDGPGYDGPGYDGPNDFQDDYYRSSNVSSHVNLGASSSKESKSNLVQFPSDRRAGDRQKRETSQNESEKVQPEKRQAYYPGGGAGRCGPRQVCCRRPLPPAQQVYRPHSPQCGVRNTQGVHGRIKNPVYVDGDSEFGEYPWQVAILKKDPQESVYVCGGTLIDHQHVLTAAHCVKSYTNFDLRVRLGEWDVNHDVEFYPYVERDVSALHVHPEFYAGTLFNDIALLRLDHPVDFQQSPHISPACLPEPHSEYAGHRCWTTGWGKDAFGDYGKYQNILKEVDVPVVSHHQCQAQLQQTRLGYDFKLHPGFICAGGEEGKDACKGDGGGPMVCERGGTWQLVGVVSWGIGCGQYGVPGVYVKVAHYLDWIRQLTGRF
ncbi:uncharacterized protein LOC129002466 isoform X1 [Macrosteles quadrilineatus]|uniref:uncharacterized protein LOC129002466 isoform X1 n=1 Tax=Macrosteles quadrilineatus TaxID=74068 RepID=UPI0023E2A51C|nr:uncharacterized protein LOC129002466 isoform X1 [Macrosteles quadrilineatus]